MVYYEQQTPPEEDRPGCLDAVLIMRALFGLLFWPLVAIVVMVADAVAIVTAFAVYPALALAPVALTVVAVWVFARWEQRRLRPPDA
ncbi:MAG: hypothetical protein M3P30_01980 [Chloroflexota bacterium]|nr:hypothetical protein [Chloroflexota bacterium]